MELEGKVDALQKQLTDLDTLRLTHAHAQIVQESFFLSNVRPVLQLRGILTSTDTTVSFST